MSEPITDLETAVRELGALPMPVGPGPRADVLPLSVAVELNDLRTRLAGMTNPPREIFLAQYDGAEPELFTTAEAARECCDDLAQVDAHGKCWDWTVNEHGIHVQFWTHPDDDRPLSETSGTVTPLVVQGDDDLSELDRLQKRVAELEEQIAALTAQGETLRASRQAKTDDVTPQVQKLRNLLAGQRDAVDGEHYTSVHHNYRIPRDLPPIGGVR